MSWRRTPAPESGTGGGQAGREPVPMRRSSGAGGAQAAAGRLQAPPVVDASLTQRALAVGMKYELGIDSFFGASHSMRPTGERHSHSFRIQASFVTESVDDNGMICGFREVSNLLGAEAKRYSNLYLNDLEPFNILQPTGENLATVIFRNLVTAVEDEMPGGPELIAVTLWENPVSYVRVGMVRPG